MTVISIYYMQKTKFANAYFTAIPREGFFKEKNYI